MRMHRNHRAAANSKRQQGHGYHLSKTMAVATSSTLKCICAACAIVLLFCPVVTQRFICGVDICLQKGFYNCPEGVEEGQKRCEECKMFYDDACGTQAEPPGCNLYCQQKLNESHAAEVSNLTKEITKQKAAYSLLEDKLLELKARYSNLSSLLLKQENLLNEKDAALNRCKITTTISDKEESLSKILFTVAIILGVFAGLSVGICVTHLYCRKHKYTMSRSSTDSSLDKKVQEQELLNVNTDQQGDIEDYGERKLNNVNPRVLDTGEPVYK